MTTSARVLPWAALAALGLALGCSPSDDEGTRPDARNDGDNGTGGDADADGDETLPDTPVDGDWTVPEIPDTPGEVCGELDWEIARVIPDMLIVLDRSNSMFDDGFWNPVREAIYTVTGAMDYSVWFGLMIFPNIVDSPVCSGYDNQCEPGHAPLVEIGEGRSIEIRDNLGPMLTCGGTPIAVTLQNARAYLDTLADSHPRFILLATDGAPNCNDALAGGSCRCTNPLGGCVLNPGNCLDDVRTNEVLTDLAGSGVQVFVLGIGTSEWTDVLNTMAASGGTGSAFFAEDPDSIRATFEEIAGAVATCEFDIEAPDPTADPTLVNFYFDGVAVPGDTADGTCDNGWGWMNPDHTRMQFCGTYCDQIMTGSVGAVTATWGCPTILI